ncbi:MAG: hypothetical protein K9N34_10050 [Candidatus Marinimicrobia bacterium]|nr:hypothetical protein [Candidatus Neomarinimicrobiota bacterium]MCF7841103.1 hypothetical protein [Candidatus Neomarinimicrobiota bacterium]MCF7903299.1 hypothetical protein [Candidatus Neomarinimicrobiota bacterium]
MKHPSQIQRFLPISWLIGIIFGCQEPPEKIPEFVIDDVFNIGLYESNNFSGQAGEIVTLLSMSSDTIYPCLNFEIVADLSATGHSLYIDIRDISIGPVCLTALGPATYNEVVDLDSGYSALIVSNGQRAIEIGLSVTDSVIHLEGNSNQYFNIIENEVWRYRPNSFYYSCGTTEETAWMYTAFRDTILSVNGITQSHYPETGWIPYPRSSSGHYVDHECLYFEYSAESTWELVKEKLINFTVENITANTGVGLAVTNWRGDSELSWLWN